MPCLIYNPPAIVEQMQATEESSLNKLNIVNRCYKVIILGQITL
jgi:hypothetical protein